MLKIRISHLAVYNRLKEIPFVRGCIYFNLSNLEQIKDGETFIQVTELLRMGNGTFKTTRVSRFADLDLVLINSLKKGYSYKIHDAAASDGITSRELFNQLSEAKISFQLWFSDKYATIKADPGWITDYYDADNVYLFSDVFGIQANRFLPYRFFMSKLLGYWVAHYKRSMPKAFRVIRLINPKVQLMDSGQMEFYEYDLMKRSESLFDVVRAMNILNSKYFSDPELKVLLTNIFYSLNEGGLFVIGRTDVKTSLNSASIYKKLDGHFIIQQNINGGTEMDYLISTYRPNPS